MSEGRDNKPRAFNFAATDLDLEWREFKQELQIWLALKKNLNQEKMLLHLLNQGGRELLRVYNTLKPLPNETPPVLPPKPYGEPKVFDNALMRLDAYFAIKENSTLNLLMFSRLKQEPGESFNKFYLRLRTHSQRCEFKGEGSEEQHLRMQIHDGATSTKVKKKAVIGDLTLDQLVKYANAQEMVEAQMNTAQNVSTSGSTETIAFMRRERGAYGRDNRQSQGKAGQRGRFGQRNEPYSRCANCGGGHGSSDVDCPARGRLCYKCQKTGHFARACRGRNQRNEGQSRRFARGTYDDKPTKGGIADSRKNAIFQVQKSEYSDEDWDCKVPCPPMTDDKVL